MCSVYSLAPSYSIVNSKFKFDIVSLQFSVVLRLPPVFRPPAP